MSPGGVLVNVLYVAPGGTVRSGRLVDDGAAGADTATTLVSRSGRFLAPGDIPTLLALPGRRESQRAALARAHQAGYRVEEA